jgi:N-acyl homoserine lactone hydrolase
VAVSLPGHTPGTTGLLLRDEGVLLAGDAVKNAWDLVRGAPPPCFGSRDAALASYRRAREIARTIVPGHDRPFRLLDGGGVLHEEGGAVELELYGDPSSDPRRLALLPPEARADGRDAPSRGRRP